MSITSFIGDNTLWFGIVIVGTFVIYKWLLLPIINKGKPIEPSEEDIKTFGEKMQENLRTEVDF